MLRATCTISFLFLAAPAVAHELSPVACPTLTIAQVRAAKVKLPEAGGYGPIFIKQQHNPYQACQADIAIKDIHCEIEDPGLMQVAVNGIVTYFLIPDSAIAQIEVHDGMLQACRLRAG